MKNAILLLTLFICINFSNVLIAQPTIISFSPVSGPIGTIDTINGTNFNTIDSNNIVFFGATKASINSSTSTRLIVTVPTGANYQYISVTNLGTNLTGYSFKPFAITFTNIGITCLLYTSPSPRD